jgi:hypothetical protein
MLIQSHRRSGGQGRAKRSVTRLIVRFIRALGQALADNLVLLPAADPGGPDPEFAS